MWWIAAGDPSITDRATAIAEFERLRTARYEDVCRRLDDGALDKTEWEALRQDLARRWALWNDLSPRFGCDVVWIRHSRTLATGGGAAGDAALLWLPLIALHVTIRRLMSSTPNKRINRALRRARCPQCGYDLRSAPDAIFKRSGGLVRPGPRLCPECGLAWPFLPPHLVAAWRTESSPSTRDAPAPGSTPPPVPTRPAPPG